MKLAAVLSILGGLLIAYSLTLSPYHDEKLFNERYSAMSSGQSEDYWKLRQEQLTLKYPLQDYGISLLAVAMAVFMSARKGRLRIETPSSRKLLVGLIFGLPFLTIGGYVFDLYQAYLRGEYPYWADSWGIPMTGAVIPFILLLFWGLLHIEFLHGPYQPATPLSQAISFKANWWLLLVSVITVLLILMVSAFGQYWYAVPGVLWLYLYLSLSASRRVAKAKIGDA